MMMRRHAVDRTASAVEVPMSSVSFDGKQDDGTRPYLYRNGNFGQARYIWPYVLFRRYVPRQVQYTFVWLIVFNATCVAWWYLFHDVFTVDQVQQFMKVGECYLAALGILVGFLLVLDWQSGTDRYQRGGTSFNEILESTQQFTNQLNGYVIAHAVSGAVNAANGERTLKMLNIIQVTVRSLPYMTMVLFRDFSNESEATRRANLRSVLHACMPADVLSFQMQLPDSSKAVAIGAAPPPPTLEQKILGDNIDLEFAVDRLLGIFDVALPMLVANSGLNRIDVTSLQEPLRKIASAVETVTSSILIVRPSAATHFITSVTVIFLITLPIVLYTNYMWYTLMLNSCIVFVTAGLLFIGRQMREPYEDPITNPCSNIDLRERADKYARMNDITFNEMRNFLGLAAATAWRTPFDTAASVSTTFSSQLQSHGP